MQVYTFGSGGRRDGIYLEKLSSTKEGVKKLIEESGCLYLDNAQTIKDIVFRDEDIVVRVYDSDIENIIIYEFDLIIFPLS